MAAEPSLPTEERVWSFFQRTRPRGPASKVVFSAMTETALRTAREELVDNQFSLFLDRHAQEAADRAAKLIEEARRFELYPGIRAMGYPFDRPFAEPIEAALGRLSNAAGRQLTIRQEL